MQEAHVTHPELPNLVTLLAHKLEGTPLAGYLHLFENVIFSLIIILFLIVTAFLATRKTSFIPKGLQNAVELLVGTIDDFISGILGPKGRNFTPFIGTLFIYILFMNLSGLIPFFKSSTSSWSTTLALALCVFLYVQYAAIKELGLVGYFDHLMGKPRGIVAFSVFIPMLMFFLHILSELVRPISLSLRLRSNIWGDDMLLAVLAGFGLWGVPLYVFNALLVIIAGVVQAVVFCLLTSIYFALVLTGHEHKKEEEHGL